MQSGLTQANLTAACKAAFDIIATIGSYLLCQRFATN
jgi:hypothetical protein